MNADDRGAGTLACRVETHLDPLLQVAAKRRDESRRGRLRVCATIASESASHIQNLTRNVACRVRMGLAVMGKPNCALVTAVFQLG